MNLSNDATGLLLLAIVADSRSGFLDGFNLTRFSQILDCSRQAVADSLDELLEGEWVGWSVNGRELAVHPRSLHWVWVQVAESVDSGQPLPSIEQIAEFLLVQRLHFTVASLPAV